MRVESGAHAVLERERLEGADALKGLLHGFENARAAGELMIRDGLDAADHLAQDQHRRRHHDDAEQGHHGVLHGHHRDKADERQQIATDRRDEQVEHLARRGGAGGEPGHELGTVAVGEKADVMLEQFREHPPLILGNDPVADARQSERLPVGGHRLDHENDGGHQGEGDDAGKIFVDVGLIDHVADQIRAQRGARRRNSHQAERDCIAPPLARRLFRQEAPDQSGRTAGVRKQPLKIRFEHTPPVARQMEPRRCSEPFLPRPERFSSGIGGLAERQRARVASLRSHASA